MPGMVDGVTEALVENKARHCGVYREMETAAPTREAEGWWWPARRVLGYALWALVLMAAGFVSRCYIRAVERTIAEDTRIEQERQDEAHRTRVAGCIARGGTWNEGSIHREHAEWCSWVRR